MTSNADLFAARREDFVWCEATIRQHSKSFYAAFSQLPSPKRESVYAIYAFCRAADDCVDIAHSREDLQQLREELEAFASGNVPPAPMWRALEAVFGYFSLDLQPFFDMLAGQERDLDFTQPATQKDLEEYCYYVAGSVGLMLLPVLCAQQGTAQQLKQPAIALGIAMQLTNLLRDVGEDFANLRVYLPEDLMRRQGYSLTDLAAKTINPAFIAVWETLAQRAGQLYGEMERSILLLDEDSRLPTLSALYLYEDILQQIRENQYDCFTQRSFVPKEDKQRLFAAAQEVLAAGQGAAPN